MCADRLGPALIDERQGCVRPTGSGHSTKRQGSDAGVHSKGGRRQELCVGRVVMRLDPQAFTLSAYVSTDGLHAYTCMLTTSHPSVSDIKCSGVGCGMQMIG